MPIYEYICNGCDEKFEKLVFNSSTFPECPSCADSDVRKIPSVFSFSSGGRTFTSSAGPSCAGCRATSCADCK